MSVSINPKNQKKPKLLSIIQVVDGFFINI